MSQQSRFEAVATVPELTAEVVATIEAHVRATNEAWESGRLPEDSVLRDVADDLVARGPHGRWTLVRHTAEKL